MDEGRKVFIRRAPITIVRVLTEGETAFPHPAGGFIIAHPDRKPLWCHKDAETNTYRHELIEPVMPPPSLPAT